MGIRAERQSPFAQRGLGPGPRRWPGFPAQPPASSARTIVAPAPSAASLPARDLPDRAAPSRNWCMDTADRPGRTPAPSGSSPRRPRASRRGRSRRRSRRPARPCRRAGPIRSIGTCELAHSSDTWSIATSARAAETSARTAAIRSPASSSSRVRLDPVAVADVDGRRAVEVRPRRARARRRPSRAPRRSRR